MPQKTSDFFIKVNEITDRDGRYPVEAYEFVNDAVVYTVEKLSKKNSSGRNHITGQELLDGVKELGIKLYGPMASQVFQEWSIKDGMSVGNIVYNMVNCQLLRTSDSDSISDFNIPLDFQKALTSPFMPKWKKMSEYKID